MIIDFHTHIFPDKLAPSAIPHLAKICNIPNQTDGTATDTLKKMDEWHVDYAVFHNIATKPNQEDTINSCAKAVHSPRLIPFAALHPKSDRVFDRLSAIKEAGFIGIKLHPDYQNFMVDDPDVFPIYDACSSLGLYVMFHAGFGFVSPDLVHAPPAKTKKILANFPHLHAILAHLGGLSMWEDVYQEIAGKNVYLDTSMCAGRIDPSLMKQILSKHNPDQMLFGSDCPWQAAKQSAEFLQTLSLPDEQLEKIFSKNACRILNITA